MICVTFRFLNLHDTPSAEIGSNLSKAFLRRKQGFRFETVGPSLLSLQQLQRPMDDGRPKAVAAEAAAFAFSGVEVVPVSLS